MSQLITHREEIARVHKGGDIDAVLSIVMVADVPILQIQDTTRSTGHVGRGYYLTRDAVGRECARGIAEVLLAFSSEEIM